MPTLTQEEFDALMQFIATGAFATSSTPSTGLNLFQDMLSQIFNEDAAVLNNQIWQPYQVFPEFNPRGLRPITQSYIDSGDPIWSTVAEGIASGDYDKASAINYIANEMAANLGERGANTVYTEDDIRRDVEEMFKEKGAVEQAYAQYQNDAKKFEAENVYGSRNLPQPTDVWGLQGGPGVVPAPVSEVSQNTIDFVNEMQRQIEESGLETFLAGKDDATKTRMVALAKQMVKEKGLLREDDRLRAMQGAGKEEASQESPSKAQLISAEEGGMFAPTISSAAAASPPTGPGSRTVLPAGDTAARDRMNYSEVPLAIKMLANLDTSRPSGNVLDFIMNMGKSELEKLMSDPALASISAQASGDINRRYAPQENQLRSMQVRQAEAMRNLDTFRQADLENINKKGITPTDYAKNERINKVQALFNALIGLNMGR
jgi:hypothetical protein